MVRFFKASCRGKLASSETVGKQGSGTSAPPNRGRCSRHPATSSRLMSGWLDCCDCLQRRAMPPVRRPRPAQSAHSAPRHGHQNAAFLEDEGDERPPPSTERHRTVLQPARPQFREARDLREDQPESTHRPVPACTSQPFEPLTQHWDTEQTSPAGRPGEPREEAASDETEAPAAVPDQRRRVSQLENIPETADTGIKTAGSGGKRPKSADASTSPPPGKWDDIAPAADREDRPDNAQPHGPGPDGGAAEETRVLSPTASKGLHFPKFRRRSSQAQREQSAAAGREPAKERHWLRRLSRGHQDDKPLSGVLTEDPPPSQPAPAHSSAAQRWGVVRDNFDLDAPLSSHWSFLESVVENFEKVDAKTYTEHLHEQPPLSSSSSDEEVPDPLEAQLLLKLAQAERIKPRKSSVSSRCVAQERQNRRSERQSQTREEAAGSTEGRTVEDQERSEAAEDSRIRPSSGSKQSSDVEQSPVQPSSAPQQRIAGEPPPVRSTAPAPSCPPPEGDTTSVPAAAAYQQHGSIFDRLLALPGGQPRRSSAPADTTQPAAAQSSPTVHHPTWFQRAEDGDLPPDGWGKQAVFRRRATVAELSLKEFLEKADERARELREEEFCGSNPYEVLSPEQRAADDHVIPIVNSQRCVQLMLADAERYLQHQYESTPSPSLRLSPCHTPRGRQAMDQGSSPGERQTEDGSGAGPGDRQTSDSSGGSPRNATMSAGQRESCEETAAPVSSCKDQASSPIAAPKSAIFPAYLSNLQSEVTLVAEALKSKLKASLNASQDPILYPSSSQSKTMSKSAEKPTSSCSSFHKSDASPAAPLSVSELSSTATTKAAAVTTPTPRNSVSQPGSQSLALLGFQQLALALARESAVDFQQLAAAPAQQPAASWPPSAAEERPLGCQSVETSPGVVTPPAVRPSGPVPPRLGPAPGATGRSQAVQTSPGVVTPPGVRLTPAAPGAPGRSQAVQTSPGVVTPPAVRLTPAAPGAPGRSQAVQTSPGVRPPVTRVSVSTSPPGVSTPPPGPATSLQRSASPAGAPRGSLTWTVPASGRTLSPSPPPPPRLLADRRQCGVSRDLSPPDTFALRLRLEGRQRAARQRRNTHLWRRAARAAAMSAPPHTQQVKP